MSVLDIALALSVPFGTVVLYFSLRRKAKWGVERRRRRKLLP